MNGTIVAVKHRNATVNPLSSNGMLVGDLIVAMDNGDMVEITAPLESTTRAGKRVMIQDGSVADVQYQSAVEMYPWLGEDFDRATGKFDIG